MCCIQGDRQEIVLNVLANSAYSSKVFITVQIPYYWWCSLSIHETFCRDELQNNTMWLLMFFWICTRMQNYIMAGILQPILSRIYELHQTKLLIFSLWLLQVLLKSSFLRSSFSLRFSQMLTFFPCCHLLSKICFSAIVTTLCHLFKTSNTSNVTCILDR